MTKEAQVIEQISVAELKRLIDTGAPRLIDVREGWEYDNGHVPGAEWIPMALVPLRKDEFERSQPCYLLCRTGSRSGQVTMWLAQQGIRAVNVDGGTDQWQRAGHPIETAAQRPRGMPNNG